MLGQGGLRRIDQHLECQHYFVGRRHQVFRRIGSYGVKLVWNVSEPLQFDAAFERYDMRGTDRVTPQSAYCRANIITVGGKFSW